VVGIYEIRHVSQAHLCSQITTYTDQTYHVCSSDGNDNMSAPIYVVLLSRLMLPIMCATASGIFERATLPK
jgi:hypothetical protein